MDPHTGEILAMASYPTFNPNDFGRRARVGAPQSRGPGSLRARIDLQARDGLGGDCRKASIKPDDIIDTQGGVIKFPAQADHRHGPRLRPLTFTDVIVKSSNVGAIKVGLRIGAERMGLYIRRFGFGGRRRRTFPARARASCGSRRS
jgi:cell division protein FtsI/penicillin-binding protein 2